MVFLDRKIATQEENIATIRKFQHDDVITAIQGDFSLERESRPSTEKAFLEKPRRKSLKDFFRSKGEKYFKIFSSDRSRSTLPSKEVLDKVYTTFEDVKKIYSRAPEQPTLLHKDGLEKCITKLEKLVEFLQRCSGDLTEKKGLFSSKTLASQRPEGFWTGLGESRTSLYDNAEFNVEKFSEPSVIVRGELGGSSRTATADVNRGKILSGKDKIRRAALFSRRLKSVFRRPKSRQMGYSPHHLSSIEEEPIEDIFSVRAPLATPEVYTGSLDFEDSVDNRKRETEKKSFDIEKPTTSRDLQRDSTSSFCDSTFSQEAVLSSEDGFVYADAISLESLSDYSEDRNFERDFRSVSEESLIFEKDFKSSSEESLTFLKKSTSEESSFVLSTSEKDDSSNSSFKNLDDAISECSFQAELLSRVSSDAGEKLTVQNRMLLKEFDSIVEEVNDQANRAADIASIMETERKVKETEKKVATLDRRARALAEFSVSVIDFTYQAELLGSSVEENNNLVSSLRDVIGELKNQARDLDSLIKKEQFYLSSDYLRERDLERRDFAELCENMFLSVGTREEGEVLATPSEQSFSYDSTIGESLGRISVDRNSFEERPSFVGDDLSSQGTLENKGLFTIPRDFFYESIQEDKGEAKAILLERIDALQCLLREELGLIAKRGFDTKLLEKETVKVRNLTLGVLSRVIRHLSEIRMKKENDYGSKSFFVDHKKNLHKMDMCISNLEGLLDKTFSGEELKSMASIQDFYKEVKKNVCKYITKARFVANDKEAQSLWDICLDEFLSGRDVQKVEKDMNFLSYVPVEQTEFPQAGVKGKEVKFRVNSGDFVNVQEALNDFSAGREKGVGVDQQVNNLYMSSLMKAETGKECVSFVRHPALVIRISPRFLREMPEMELEAFLKKHEDTVVPDYIDKIMSKGITLRKKPRTVSIKKIVKELKSSILCADVVSKAVTRSANEARIENYLKNIVLAKAKKEKTGADELLNINLAEVSMFTPARNIKDDQKYRNRNALNEQIRLLNKYTGKEDIPSGEKDVSASTFIEVKNGARTVKSCFGKSIYFNFAVSKYISDDSKLSLPISSKSKINRQKEDEINKMSFKEFFGKIFDEKTGKFSEKAGVLKNVDPNSIFGRWLLDEKKKIKELDTALEDLRAKAMTSGLIRSGSDLIRENNLVKEIAEKSDRVNLVLDVAGDLYRSYNSKLYRKDVNKTYELCSLLSYVLYLTGRDVSISCQDGIGKVNEVDRRLKKIAASTVCDNRYIPLNEREKLLRNSLEAKHLEKKRDDLLSTGLALDEIEETGRGFNKFKLMASDFAKKFSSVKSSSRLEKGMKKYVSLKL